MPRTFPERGSDVREGELLITSDPIYMIGCSTWTTGWTSCLRQPDGQYRKGAVWWSQCPGTRLAALLSPHTMEIAGVERRKMRARAWVHTFRDGRQGYDRLYGNPDDQRALAAALKARGIVPVQTLPRGLRVVGHVVGGTRPYLDTLRAVRVTLRSPGRARKGIVLTT